jgi:hypothetical protein
MDTASLSEIKAALKVMSREALEQQLLRMAKYKKENKELLSFILFDEEDKLQFIKDCKHEMGLLFASINFSTSYVSAKGLRKILKFVTKCVRFSADKTVEIELLAEFCSQMSALAPRFRSSTVLAQLYDKQVEKVYRAMEHLHEDIRADYRKLAQAL